MSFARDKAHVTNTLTSGNQVIMLAGLGVPPFLIPGITVDIMNNPTMRPEPKLITNHGMTQTKTSVLSVARLALFEVRPIHMPNQQRVIRFAAVTRLLATAMVIVNARFAPAPRPAAMNREVVCCESAVPASCTHKNKIAGTANKRSN